MSLNDSTSDELLLKSENAIKLGKVHCIILAADTKFMEEAGIIDKEPPVIFDFRPVTLTPFGHEASGHFIKWWVKKNATQLGDVSTKIKAVYDSLVNLKRSSEELSVKSRATTYDELLKELKDFANAHSNDVSQFESLVLTLNTLNYFAPSLLFSCPPWSTSDHSERFFKIEGKTTDAQIAIGTRIVFGLWSNGSLVLDRARSDMESEYAESVDPEDYQSYGITYQSAFPRAAKKILQEFRTYFQEIRESVDLISSEISTFLNDGALNNEIFLRSFIAKAVPRFRPERELWDFKETISAWHNTSDDRLKADFAYNVAAFANHKGGLIVIGVDDKNRKIVGIDKVETRIQQSRSILEGFLDNQISFEIFPIALQDDEGKNVACIVLKIPQTAAVIGVKETAGGASYKYPVRTDDGIKYRSHPEVAKTKEGTKDNFAFSREIAEFTYFTPDIK
jgi:hypothetical protein